MLYGGSTPDMFAFGLGFNTTRKRKKIGFADLAKTIAAKWKTLGENERLVYNAQASVEQGRYKRELDTWKRNQSRRKHEANEWTTRHRENVTKMLNPANNTSANKPYKSAELLQMEHLMQQNANQQQSLISQMMLSSLLSTNNRNPNPTQFNHNNAINNAAPSLSFLSNNNASSLTNRLPNNAAPSLSFLSSNNASNSSFLSSNPNLQQTSNSVANVNSQLANQLQYLTGGGECGFGTSVSTSNSMGVQKSFASLARPNNNFGTMGGDTAASTIDLTGSDTQTEQPQNTTSAAAAAQQRRSSLPLLHMNNMQQDLSQNNDNNFAFAPLNAFADSSIPENTTHQLMLSPNTARRMSMPQTDNEIMRARFSMLQQTQSSSSSSNPYVVVPDTEPLELPRKSRQQQRRARPIEPMPFSAAMEAPQEIEDLTNIMSMDGACHDLLAHFNDGDDFFQ